MPYYLCGMAVNLDGESSWDQNQSSIEDTDRLFPAEDKDTSSSKSKFRHIFDRFKQRGKKDGIRLFLLVLFNGLYLYFGGGVFYLLEREPRQVFNLDNNIESIFSVIKESSVSNVSLGELSSSEIMQRLRSEDMTKLKEVLRTVHLGWKKDESTEWTLTNAVFFASTVVTTIGYGNLAPSTAGGRWFCVIYAIVGIPLTLMLLAMVGRILSKYINDLCGFVVNYVKKYLHPGYEYDSTDGTTELNVPVWLAFVFITVFISLDALILMSLEDWSFPVSLYFIFITLTTIGFGDIVPQNTAVVWFNVTLMYLGLAAVSITINLLIANIGMQYRKHKAKIKFMKTIEKQLDSEDENVNEKTPLTSDHNGNPAK